MKQIKFKKFIIVFIVSIVLSLFIVVSSYFIFYNDVTKDLSDHDITIDKGLIYKYYYAEHQYETFDEFVQAIDNNEYRGGVTQKDIVNESCTPEGINNRDYFFISSVIPTSYIEIEINDYSSVEEFESILEKEINNTLIDNNCNYLSNDQIDDIEDLLEYSLNIDFYNQNKNNDEEGDDFIERLFTGYKDLDTYIEQYVINF